ncbi:hypothetical protein NL676_013907 [Syzygium grande]|nr:hypothetical protein NL676_013907 [Syzygium grande]
MVKLAGRLAWREFRPTGWPRIADSHGQSWARSGARRSPASLGPADPLSIPPPPGSDSLDRPPITDHRRRRTNVPPPSRWRRRTGGTPPPAWR